MATPAGDHTAAQSTRKPFASKVFASAARTATPTPTGPNGEDGFDLPAECTAVTVVTVTTASSTPSTVVTLQGWDPASQTWQTLVASAAIVANGTSRITAGPGAPTTANLSQNTALPDKVRVTATHGNGNSHTYSVGIAFS